MRGKRKVWFLFELSHFSSVLMESFKGESLDLVTRFFDFIINKRSVFSKLKEELFPKTLS